MKKLIQFKILLGLTCLFCSINSYAKSVSPIDFGLLEAHNAIERFNILYNTHATALNHGYTVSYKGIDTLYIEIPSDAAMIPLGDNTDFAGCVFVVMNNKKEYTLFWMHNSSTDIDIPKSDLNAYNFKNISPINKGYNILTIEDKKPWVMQRTGYNYGATRKDIILIKDGKALNKYIMPYHNSEPKCSYIQVNNKKKTISNITIIRDKRSVCRTFCFKLENQNNLYLNNITIRTPESDIYGDVAINILNCTNIYCNNINIEGTYSKTNKYGYGIGMNNVWNCTFNNLNAQANWGIFGNNNVNCATLTNCNINRFDIHCYGKDVHCKNVTFVNLYNQFSSLFGNLVFDNCQFINSIPVLTDDSYSAYTQFSITFLNCKFTVDPKRPYIVDMRSSIISSKYTREELSMLYWPNISIDKMFIDNLINVPFFSLFHTSNKNGVILDGDTRVTIRNLVCNGLPTNATIQLSNNPVKPLQDIKIYTVNSPEVVCTE